MRFIFYIIFSFFIIKFNAQVYTYQNATKFHYEIVSNENDSINKRIYQAAYDYKKFDEVRFLDSRRNINISGYNAYLILYSANELLERYGKQISPFTILPDTDYSQVSLFFTDNKFPEFSIQSVP
jgi:hypothetical protein